MKWIAVLLAGGVAMSASAPLSQDQAERFQQKLNQIVQQGEGRKPQPHRTTVTETEVNSYLTYKAGPLLPVGLTEPTIGIRGEGRLSGRAVVDLDVVRQKKSSGGWFDPASYLTGRLPVTATGVLHTKGGTGKFQLERAEVSGIPVPRALLQEIVSFYTKSPEKPNGVGLDDVFELPAGIDRIEVGQGQAVIVQ